MKIIEKIDLDGPPQYNRLSDLLSWVEGLIAQYGDSNYNLEATGYESIQMNVEYEREETTKEAARRIASEMKTAERHKKHILARKQKRAMDEHRLYLDLKKKYET